MKPLFLLNEAEAAGGSRSRWGKLQFSHKGRKLGLEFRCGIRRVELASPVPPPPCVFHRRLSRASRADGALGKKANILRGEEERMAAFDLRRNSDVKISQVTQLYWLFVPPERAQDRRASSCHLTPSAQRLGNFNQDPLSPPVYLIHSAKSLCVAQRRRLCRGSRPQRTSAADLHLSATCGLATRNHSRACRVPSARGRRAGGPRARRLLCENRGRGTR